MSSSTAEPNTSKRVKTPFVFNLLLARFNFLKKFEPFRERATTNHHSENKTEHTLALSQNKNQNREKARESERESEREREEKEINKTDYKIINRNEIEV
jgi:hypothetical protein